MRLIFSLVLSLVMLCSQLTCLAAGNPEQKEMKTVKVGYLLYTGYQEGAEGMPKSGYGYEYLQKLSYYANWQYEYVYGGFSDLLAKLQRGEIDIMGNLSYTPERAKTISFGNELQGKEQYYLFVREDNTSIRADDFKTLNGLRIGINKNSVQAQFFQEWMQKRKLHCEIIYYDSSKQRTADMNLGKLDATVAPNVIDDENSRYHWYSVAKIGESPFYFGVNKKRPDLLDELNRAQQQVLQSDWFYNEKVYLKYYGDSAATVTALSPTEYNWLKHKGKLTIGYTDNSLPYANWDKKKNELVGILSVYKEHAEKRYQTQIETKYFHNLKTLREALNKGEVDAIYPAYSSYWIAESRDILVTSPLSKTYLMLLYKGDYTDSTTSKIAVSESSSLQQYFAKEFYPKSELIMLPDISSCVKAVAEGRVNSTLFTADTYYAYRNELKALYDCQLLNTGKPVPIGFAVRRGDISTYSFMKKSLQGIGPERISKALVEGGYAVPEPSVEQFLSRNVYLVLITAILFTAILACFSVYYILTKRKEATMLRSVSDLNKKAFIDFATVLPNKNKCKELLSREGPLTVPTACFMFDLNDLKLVNDTLGHETGDDMIASFASVLRKVIPAQYFVGRFGGDEFLMIAENISGHAEIADILAELKQITESFNKSNKTFKLSYGVGYAYSRDYDSITMQELFNIADEKMYANKKASKEAGKTANPRT